ncbi:putative protein OS=Tsukamurella paurometabola (strain ATCC 8368 / DSM / CCUG 35730 /CIP 100753 / JCM 10117 / KCTC 9821 / NBRC 16120 / NCIMB 702349/ NCTC 13040) OX=521096 GN=Tpau_0413 PE=4 SV=1 [Tsukamurella paurometabola]|uniref:Uncharacterized protein n=1 Tax=Tsukamurella paurometabola (strain ATCC 8368 / DSM 20162 / CCUG 35730 / CIP 100753 / JCM 10117 / KCTC 9821 / NBRC 16120 / NCIMB 702349 / NCTC 13040) TaxID=521096 RepID=D5URK1_TSUPD|nr:hypothetical protein [Tsukamurella paurometabola]ADG77054.1 hypothetical protein Tpau_0413 [Tsukamurella paurometabola DSM 20162]SUP42614.1 Uncharacterised protein [Tsukamurella paurometabola]
MSLAALMMLPAIALQAAAGNWDLMLLTLGAALALLLADVRSAMRWHVLRWTAVVSGIAGAALMMANGSRIFVFGAAVSLLLWGRLALIRQSGANRSAFPSEDLVGLTVAEAKGRIGFDDDRAPHGLEEPTLVAVPAADIDLQSPSLIVTGVVVDDREGIMTFGVTEPDRLSADLDRDDLQRQLVDQVGGCPADILPLAKPDPLSKYRPRAM